MTKLFPQVTNDLVAVGPAVLAAGDVNPEVFAVGGLENELVEIGVVLQIVEPLAGGFQVGMAFVDVPGGIAGEGQAEVSGLAKGVLGGVGSTDTDVELVATVAAGDDDRATDEGAEGLKNFLAELLQRGDVLWGDSVVDVVLLCGSRLFKLSEREMFG